MGVNDDRIQHVDALEVRQAKAHLADLRWYVVTANGFPVSRGFRYRIEAEMARALKQQLAREEVAHEDPED